jgi:hypothetical protein
VLPVEQQSSGSAWSADAPSLKRQASSARPSSRVSIDNPALSRGGSGVDVVSLGGVTLGEVTAGSLPQSLAQSRGRGDRTVRCQEPLPTLPERKTSVADRRTSLESNNKVPSPEKMAPLHRRPFHTQMQEVRENAATYGEGLTVLWRDFWRPRQAEGREARRGATWGLGVKSRKLFPSRKLYSTAL